MCLILDLLRALVNHSQLSLNDHQLACNSHIYESETTPSHATKDIFTSDALPATFLITEISWQFGSVVMRWP